MCPTNEIPEGFRPINFGITEGEDSSPKNFPTDPSRFKGVPTAGQLVEDAKEGLSNFLQKAMDNPGGVLAVVGGLGVLLASAGFVTSILVAAIGVNSLLAGGSSLLATAAYGAGGSLIGWAGAEATKAIGDALGNGRGGLEKAANSIATFGRAAFLMGASSLISGSDDKPSKTRTAILGSNP
ncbi:MAG: hypothetical protein EBQ96_09600 [Proteobacteria bacterium]|nr:hypothetical protein [Pseudomonadota bacterium]